MNLRNSGTWPNIIQKQSVHLFQCTVQHSSVNIIGLHLQIKAQKVSVITTSYLTGTYNVIHKRSQSILEITQWEVYFSISKSELSCNIHLCFAIKASKPHHSRDLHDQHPIWLWLTASAWRRLQDQRKYIGDTSEYSLTLQRFLSHNLPSL